MILTYEQNKQSVSYIYESDQNVILSFILLGFKTEGIIDRSSQEKLLSFAM